MYANSHVTVIFARKGRTYSDVNLGPLFIVDVTVSMRHFLRNSGRLRILYLPYLDLCRGLSHKKWNPKEETDVWLITTRRFLQVHCMHINFLKIPFLW